jgi:hypothetical protein
MKEAEFLQTSEGLLRERKKAEATKKQEMDKAKAKAKDARQADIEKQKKQIQEELRLNEEMRNNIRELFRTHKLSNLNYFANPDYKYNIQHDIQALQSAISDDDPQALQNLRQLGDPGNFDQRRQNIEMFMQDHNQRNILKKTLRYAADQVNAAIPRTQRGRQRLVQLLTNRVSVAGFIEVVAVMTSILASLARYGEIPSIGENRSMELILPASEYSIYLYLIGITILTLTGGYLPESFLQPITSALIP